MKQLKYKDRPEVVRHMLLKLRHAHTIPAVDYLGRDFDKIVAISKMGKFLWVHQDFRG